MEGKFIIVVVVALFFIAFIQLMKIYDLAAKVRGKKSQEIITRGENMLMANLMLVFMFAFFGFTIWLISIYGANSGLYEAATVHGKQIDDLLMFNWWIILPVFFGTNFLLFFFSWKYYHREERKASYISHNNKLELVWTVIPAIVLSFIVIYGLRTWNEIMYNKEDGQVVEVYAYQFGWIARYAGPDNALGKADFKLVSATNPLGIINDSTIKETYAEIDKKVKQITIKLSDNKIDGGGYLLPDKKVSKLKEDLGKLKRRKYRIEAGIDRKELNDTIYASSNDDVQVQEIHLVKDQPYTFKFRSRDVIHCPWFPHFRAQINAVPGMETNFKLTPTITTMEMRAKPDVIEHWENINVIHNERKRRIGEQEEEVIFDYILLCNKICGAGHSNMQLKVIVETQDEFDKWIQNNGDKKRLTISGEEVDWSTTKSKASL
jgi:cytochrome c oxidase subunit 2